MKALKLKLTLPILIALAAGCTTAGSGAGLTVAGEDTVHFVWSSTGPTTGTMTATLSDGRSYSGQYFQITDSTVDGDAAPWYVWDSGWPEGPYSADPRTLHATHYSGRIVANLGRPGGEHMRCDFELVSPRDGVSGGGTGQCRMPDGSTIDATFPTA